MMNESKKQRFKYLIDLSLQGRENESEREELNAILKEDWAIDCLETILIDSFSKEKEKVDLDKEESQAILTKILNFEVKRRVKTKSVPIKKWISVAAVIFVVLVPYLLNKTTLDNKNQIQQVYQRSIVESSQVEGEELIDFEPADHKAQLVLSSGELILLDGLKMGEELEKNGLFIKKSEEGFLSVNLSDRLVSSKLSNKKNMNKISTPNGGTYHITLPDGSEVYLNSASTLTFPSQFEENERRVFFEGEAYFKIIKDESKRFVISSNHAKLKQEISVYGTEFNLLSYKDDDFISTTLINGSIKIKDLRMGQERFINPLEEYKLTDEGHEVKRADIDASLAWRNNVFYFVDEPLENVMKQICRWYDVKVKYENDGSDVRIWGQVSRDRKLSSLLKILEKSNGIGFEIKQNVVHVRP